MRAHELRVLPPLDEQLLTPARAWHVTTISIFRASSVTVRLAVVSLGRESRVRATLP